MKSFATDFLTNSAELPNGLQASGSGEAAPHGVDFKQTLAVAAEHLVAPQQAAAEAVSQFTRGTDGDLHDTLMAVDKADVSLKFFVTARNRCLEAYREIMRMGS